MEKVEFKIGDCLLEIVRDITKQDTDAIVNAANKQLAPEEEWPVPYTEPPGRSCGKNVSNWEDVKQES